MTEYPRRHEVRPELGITEEVARELDKQLAESETGNPDGDVYWDDSSETYASLAQSDLGDRTYARHKVSSNEQIAFASLVHRTKNENPDFEFEDAYDLAVDKWNAQHGSDDEDDE
jgi:hypothetical protein